LSNTLTINVTLPENFLDQLEEVITDELAIAQTKWKIRLSDEQQEVVRKGTLAQLRSKVSSLSKNAWDLGSKLVINASGDTGAIAYSESSKPKTDKAFILNKNGWSVTTEEADSVVPGDVFYESLTNTLFTWTRTAVFYGVGSYNTK
jgi:hypothetical protein